MPVIFYDTLIWSTAWAYAAFRKRGSNFVNIGDLNYNNIYFECYFHFAFYDAIQDNNIGAKN